MSTTANSILFFRHVVARIWPGAKAAVRVQPYGAGEKFSIMFTSGAMFEGDQPEVVFESARSHAEIVKRLTGKYP